MGRPIRVAHRVGLHIVVAPQSARRAEAEERHREALGEHQREMGMMALTQQLLDGLHEFVAEGDGHYFLTPAEAKDILEFVEGHEQALRAAVAEEREACAHIADEFDSGTEADVGIGIIYNPRDEMARHIAAAIRQRDEIEKSRG